MKITGLWKLMKGKTKDKIQIRELWRENIGQSLPFFYYFWELIFFGIKGLHTCDRRRDASEIKSDFPMISFERGFNQTDTLWGPTYQVSWSTHSKYFKIEMADVDWKGFSLQETGLQLQVRIREALSQIFNDRSYSKLRCEWQLSMIHIKELKFNGISFGCFPHSYFHHISLWRYQRTFKCHRTSTISNTSQQFFNPFFKNKTDVN